MPELPETETIARDLHAAIGGAQLRGATVHRSDVLREIGEHAVHDTVRGLFVRRVWRRAKLVVLDLAHNHAQTRGAHTALGARFEPHVPTPLGAHFQPDRYVEPGAHVPTDDAPTLHLVVQPRFTGALLVDDGTLPPDQLNYLTVSFPLSDGRSLHYRDVRRLGTVALMSSRRFQEYAGTLGPEPLDAEFGIAEFSALVRASRRSIKPLLMDQSRLAGIGNIYANEALWRAGIDPSRVAATLTDQQVALLLDALRNVLHASIAARGTSFRDYRDARGQRGGFVQQLAVYGRGGEPCPRCGRKLVETHAVDGRTTVLCASCQR